MAPRPVETTKMTVAVEKEASTSSSPPLFVCSVAEAGLRATDILMGRGSGPSQNEGNKRFRAVVWETYQEHAQEEQESKRRKGASVNPSAPVWMNAGTKARLCRVVKAKIARLNGRFLQRITSAADVKDDSLVYITRQGVAKNPDGTTTATNRKIYFQIVDDRLVLDKIKQTFRFLMDQQFGKRPHSVPSPGSEDIKARPESGTEASSRDLSSSTTFLPGPLHSNALSQSMNDKLKTSQRSLASSEDILARFRLSQHQPFFPPAPAASLLPPTHLGVLPLDMISSAQVFLRVQQQRREENQRALALLQLMRSQHTMSIGGNMDVTIFERAIAVATAPTTTPQPLAESTLALLCGAARSPSHTMDQKRQSAQKND
jgi:hypothetical protein